jgi:pyroglutamyl-peptidase
LPYNLEVGESALEETDAGAGLRSGGIVEREPLRARPPTTRVLLLTGFEPYNGAEINPSGEIVRELDGTEIGGIRIVGRQLPVSSAVAPGVLRSAIDELEPSAVLMLGVWPGRSVLTVERLAVNVLDFPFPDNDGRQPIDTPVTRGGAAAFFSTVPVRAVAGAWHAADLPGAVSNTAGTYLCNQAFYVALEHTAPTKLQVAFVHIPTVPSEASRHDPPHPSMALSTLIEGVTVAVEAIAALAVDAAA